MTDHCNRVLALDCNSMNNNSTTEPEWPEYEVLRNMSNLELELLCRCDELRKKNRQLCATVLEAVQALDGDATRTEVISHLMEALNHE